jgi:integrase
MPKVATGLYKRGKIWWGRISIAGREYRHSLRTGDRSAAKEWHSAWIKKLVDSTRFGIDRHIWQEAVVVWKGFAEDRVKPSTLERYVSSLRQVSPLLRNLEVRSIRRRELMAVANRAGVTPATRKRDVTAVLSVLKACESWEWIDRAPALPYRYLRERQHVIELPAPAEVDRFVAACPPMLGRLVRLLEQTGMRLEEAASLQWRQVDLDRSAILLYRTKGGRPRTVALSVEAVATLRSIPRRPDAPWVFWRNEQRPDRYNCVDGLLCKVRKRASPPIPFRTHDLRHRYAIEFMRKGGSIYTLRDQLGHTVVSTTEAYLRYLTPAEAAIAVRALGIMDTHHAVRSTSF